MIVWTTEQISSLAPSKSFLKTSRINAAPEKWPQFGVNDAQYIWGLYPNQKKAPFQVKIALDELTLACTCASRRFPCAHGLGLLLMFMERPSLFPPTPPPDWMADWIAQRTKQRQLKRQRDALETSRPVHHDEKRLTTVLNGLEKLDLWLQDMVRNGLAGLHHKKAAYWGQIADRLVDAQISSIAQEIRQIPRLINQETDWPERLLSQIGRLHLLVEGFHHFDGLPPEIQADLRTAVGWPVKQIPTDQPGWRDKWHIVGNQTEQTGKRYIQRTWLWGQRSNRPALIIYTAHGLRHKNYSLLNGVVLDADLRFYPGTTPLRAQIGERYQTIQPQKPVVGYPTIMAATKDYSAALAANPWLKQFPMALSAVVPALDGDNWLLHDEDGRFLHLSPDTKQGWYLRALSGGHPVPLFGIWDGRYLDPLTVWADGRWLPLYILRGIR